MKALFFLATLGLSALTAHGQRSTLTEITSVATSDAAKTGLTEVDKYHLEFGPQSPEFFEGKTKTQLMEMRAKSELNLRDASIKFYEAFPQDPLRWEAVLHLVMIQPSFIKEIKPGFEDAKGTEAMQFLVTDEEAKAEWAKKLTVYETALRTANDVPW